VLERCPHIYEGWKLERLRLLWGEEAGNGKGLPATHKCAVYEEGHEDKVPEGGPKSKRRGIAREKVLRVRQEWSKARALGSAGFVAGIQGGCVLWIVSGLPARASCLKAISLD